GISGGQRFLEGALAVENSGDVRINTQHGDGTLSMQELANAVGGHLSGEAVVAQNIDQLATGLHGQRGTKNHGRNSVSKSATNRRHESQALVGRKNEAG